MSEETRRAEGYDEQGIFQGIPVGREKVLAIGAMPGKGDNYPPLVVELTAHRPVSASSAAVYAVRAYRTDSIYGSKPKPIAFGMDRAEIRTCWMEATGCELSDATFAGVL